MTQDSLIISVRLQDSRYHGSGEWPPSPARLFQALTAGAGLCGNIEKYRVALEWLETCGNPVIAAPDTQAGQKVTLMVPNNNLDSVGGNPRLIAEIRTKKQCAPKVFDRPPTFLYAWKFDDNEQNRLLSKSVCELSEQLYQFGRSADIAWAWGEVVEIEELKNRLQTYHGTVHYPSLLATERAVSHSTNEIKLLCPVKGSFKSLEDRYRTPRFGNVRKGGTNERYFIKPPKANFRQAVYDCPPSRFVYEFHERSDDFPYFAWPLARAFELVVLLRDKAVDRLSTVLPSQESIIDRVFIGRKPDGSNAGPISERVRLVPLPSIGNYHADRGIRRLLVEIPVTCPLRAEDISWAFSGLNVRDFVLVAVTDRKMLRNYGIGQSNGHTKWRTVTPVALSQDSIRCAISDRRIQYAANAVIQALRQADVPVPVETLHLQREPFEANNETADAFAHGTRFTYRRLWHVEIVFKEPLRGPLIIGDGRFMGLGLMSPVGDIVGPQMSS